MVIHNSRPVSIVPGWFLCFFFKIPGWSLMVSGGFFGYSRFLFGCSWFHVGFYIFSRFQVGFSWCQVSFHGFSRFQVDFSWFKVVFHGFFMVPGLVFMIPGGYFRH